MNTHSSLFFKWLLLLTLVFSSCTTFPDRSPSSEVDKRVSLETPSCQNFLDYAVRQTGPSLAEPDQAKFDPNHPISETSPGFATDGLVVMKDNQVVYEYYNADPQYRGDPQKGLYLRDTPHSLWSSSKTVSATLFARAMYERMKDAKGNTLSPSQTLVNYFSPPDHYKQTGLFSKITIEDLLAMSSGFKWDENYESGIQASTFIPMLYFKDGQQDMLSYAIKQPMIPEGPGVHWNYSGGNSMLLLSILKKTYGDQAFAELPWTLLYDELGIRKEHTAFERDGKGVFIGNSYVYLRPLDMAKIGQLYLNGGVWNSKRLLDESWVKTAQEISRAALNPATPISYIHEEGVYGRRGFWLNQKIVQSSGATYGPEFPDSPKDMYFMAGHYGQMVIILPSQHMVIARTGHDPEYWSKINRFVSKAVSCFASEVKKPKSSRKNSYEK